MYCNIRFSIVEYVQLQGLKANPDREAKGTVVNASLDNARGPLATLPVQNGTLLKEDFVLCGEAHVKVCCPKFFFFRVSRVELACAEITRNRTSLMSPIPNES